jgi:hypothetical protein
MSCSYKNPKTRFQRTDRTFVESGNREQAQGDLAGADPLLGVDFGARFLIV